MATTITRPRKAAVEQDEQAEQPQAQQATPTPAPSPWQLNGALSAVSDGHDLQLHLSRHHPVTPRELREAIVAALLAELRQAVADLPGRERVAAVERALQDNAVEQRRTADNLHAARFDLHGFSPVRSKDPGPELRALEDAVHGLTARRDGLEEQRVRLLRDLERANDARDNEIAVAAAQIVRAHRLRHEAARVQAFAELLEVAARALDAVSDHANALGVLNADNFTGALVMSLQPAPPGKIIRGW